MLTFPREKISGLYLPTLFATKGLNKCSPASVPDMHVY